MTIIKKNSQIKKNQSEVVLHLTSGKDTVELFFDAEKETIWATQNTLTKLFNTTKQNVSKHVKKIFAEGELEEIRTVNQKLTVRVEGKREVEREVIYYNLDIIIAVGYRINSDVATRFRIWATERLSEYMIKGFTMDDERLKKYGGRYFEELLARIRDIRNSERNLYQKITDIYATSMDYNGSDEGAQLFFKTVQNKMHFAVTGKTAAEIINERADSEKPLMGVTNFRGEYLLQRDIVIAKNYLAEEELKSLNLLTDAYLSFAEIQAARKVPMKMSDWDKKLNEYLRFSSYEVLGHAGKISHDDAVKKAETEFGKYKEHQNKAWISDFDKILEIKINEL